MRCGKDLNPWMSSRFKNTVYLALSGYAMAWSTHPWFKSSAAFCAASWRAAVVADEHTVPVG